MAKENENQGILLESGTNEFEIVEFQIGGVHYGVNVAKVREVIAAVPVVKMPSAHPNVDGLFTLRGVTVPLINLQHCLHIQGAPNPRNIIVTEINGYTTGFLVDSVARIHRVSWTQMEPPPNVSEQSLVVGIVKMQNKDKVTDIIDNKILLLLDFETILSTIIPEINKQLTTFEDTNDDVQEKRNLQHVVVAEDSPLLRSLLVKTLTESGYKDVKEFSNGQLAWDYLENMAESGIDIEKNLQIIVSDIEMPAMDGHRLLKMVRENERLQEVPLVFFSSLINDEMRRKGEALGANAQISKPEIGNLIAIIDDLIFGKKE
jgi:two-component system chemotaxis response regulator CheV